ncbi:hypothetical protein D9619_011112 [Psilocybe cf. subviscida]|uniref:AAA+ ATPase domain-containing protein n=1 Tax=Psilocybe cf. subviscida TaxID=2480587 RepID=A0A8H5BJ63_9AGAR|nr:hypothetical protein D9619_011112 [Psilocybe cf. subviscida]
MHRRVSSLIKNAAPSAPPSSGALGFIDDDDTVTASTVVREIPPPSLKVKRVDHYYSSWTKSWKYKNTNSKITLEGFAIVKGGENDIWNEFSFVIVRKISELSPIFKLVVKSPYILKACKDVISSWPGVSWNSDPLELDPDIFITFHQRFLEYAANLHAKKPLSLEEDYTLSSVQLLNNTIATDYSATLAHIGKLTAHGEITYSTLHAILVPRGLMIQHCSLTGLPRVFILESWTRVNLHGMLVFQLILKSMDLVDHAMLDNVAVGRVSTTVHIMPMRDSEALVAQTIERGRKWASLIGVHHRQYNGVAGLRKAKAQDYVRHNVKSRIMVDRSSFRRLNPRYGFPTVFEARLNHTTMTAEGNDPRFGVGHCVQIDEGTEAQPGLSDDDLLLTPTVVYGFSLHDKMWFEFSVEQISPIVWEEDAFANLVLPRDRKELLKSLVEAHHAQVGVTDFIRGKGEGLVVNLYGPPGVGKTLSAEATSEHIRRPLYIVGGGDLGTNASQLEQALERILDLATTWKAIVLIDEADVFLERRSLHDLERNAMVAVFLRHVEYYRGILFMTTNRVETFDEAFLSRIHVGLHFPELSQESKEQVWTAFIARIGPQAVQSITTEHIKELARRNINGRQIKNAARTAYSLALGKGENLEYDHLRLTLDAMEEFTRAFEQK